jgi:LPS export ABC transporter permease LptG/LPS export ABC transporter permease LptF
MKTIRRYILREITGPFFLGLLVFSFVLLIGIIGQPSARNPLSLLVQQNITFRETLLIFIYLMPRILTLSLPMAVLLGILVGLGRLSADSEITALRSSGIGTLHLTRPVLLFALLAWVIAFMNSAFWYPKSLERMRTLANEVALRSISTEVREGVFEEGFSSLILFVQKTSIDKTVWSNIFVADVSDKNQLKITLANAGGLISDPIKRTLQLHLEEGAHHSVENRNPGIYQVMPFDRIEIPVAAANLSNLGAPSRILVEEMRFFDLWKESVAANSTGPQRDKEMRARKVELNDRLALSISVIIFALLGIPLGVVSKRSGKSYGFIASLLIFIIYYLLFLQGNNFAKSGRLPAFLGPWIGNLFFLLIGLYLLVSSDRRLQTAGFFHSISDLIFRGFGRIYERGNRLPRFHRLITQWKLGPQKIRLASPMILDRYIIKGLIIYFCMLLAAFVSIFIIFTFFELLNDVIENRIPSVVVFDYFLFLLPQILFYMFPLSLLVAVLVNFNLLTRTSQITAIKASGVSLYRISISVIVVSLFLCGVSFLLQEYLLPPCNQRQDALRAIIKGKPPRTHAHPGRKWMVGEQSKIINYTLFDEDRLLFGEISIFEFETGNFKLKRRIYATRAEWDSSKRQWVFFEGWSQGFKDQHTVPEEFHRFERAEFASMTELPQYFKKEVKVDTQMRYQELSNYISDLKKSGFDVTKLEVALHKKISFPTISLIMCLLAIPFSFSSGKHGSLYGVGLSILIGIIYWVMVGFFEQIGGVGKLVPILAAWAPNLIFGATGTYLIFTIDT